MRLALLLVAVMVSTPAAADWTLIGTADVLCCPKSSLSA